MSWEVDERQIMGAADILSGTECREGFLGGSIDQYHLDQCQFSIVINVPLDSILLVFLRVRHPGIASPVSAAGSRPP